MGEVSLERRASVRAANQEIVRTAESFGFADRVPLLCECGDPDCKGFVRMGADAFTVVATQRSWFVTGDAHGARFAVHDSSERDEIVHVAR